MPYQHNQLVCIWPANLFSKENKCKSMYKTLWVYDHLAKSWQSWDERQVKFPPCKEFPSEPIIHHCYFNNGPDSLLLKALYRNTNMSKTLISLICTNVTRTFGEWVVTILLSFCTSRMSDSHNHTLTKTYSLDNSARNSWAIWLQ